jgi:uncharacterized membrane protein
MLDLPASLPRRIALLVLGVFYVGAGANHFADPDFYVRIMPPYFPAHLQLVYLSGVFEILGGAGVFPARTRRLAGHAIVALLIAFLPVHIHMAINPESFAHMASPWALYARLPLQVVLIAWAEWATREDAGSRIAARR